MTTMAINSSSSFWNWFSLAQTPVSQPDDAEESADQQIAKMRTNQPRHNPPDLGIHVSDESTAGESLG